MVDGTWEQFGEEARDNIRTLVYLFGQELDERITTFRRGTPYENVRASDIRVFVQAASGGSSISAIARRLGISRQAVHMSAQRLKELGVLEMQAMQSSRRDMTLALTETGRRAMGVASQQIRNLEAEIIEVIGAEGLETLRKTLRVLIAHAKSKSGSRAKTLMQPE
jgi:DNA-binding MarR family transcriptional regulator